MRLSRTLVAVGATVLAGGTALTAGTAHAAPAIKNRTWTAGAAHAAPAVMNRGWSPTLISAEPLYNGSAVRLRYTDASPLSRRRARK
jgi:hypothetical protein